MSGPDSMPGARLARRFVPIGMFALFAAFLYQYVARDLPTVGHDFRYYLPRLIDSQLFYRVNGFAIQWSTPSFGGGLPSYPNPQQMQFSLPQLLVLWVDPWIAAILSVMTFALAGYASLYLFLTRTLKLHWTAATLGAFFIVGNGFFIQHALVGHFGYFQFPLLAIVLLAAFSRLPVAVAAAVCAGVVSLLVHQAGFYTIVIWALSLSMCVPLLVLARPEVVDLRRLVKVGGLALLGGLLVSASKLGAVAAYMRFFPRAMDDHYGTTTLAGLWGTLLQLLGVMNLIPVRMLTALQIGRAGSFLRKMTGAEYGLWELDISLSPALLAALAIGAWSLRSVARSGAPTARPRRLQIILASACLALAVWLTADVGRAQGWLHTAVKELPVMRSLHVNVRFVAAFIFPAALAAALALDRTRAACRSVRLYAVIFVALCALAVGALGSYFVIRDDGMARNFDVTSTRSAWAAVNAGETFPVERISDVKEDADTFSRRASGWKTYEPLFGYELEAFRPETTPGTVFSSAGGYFNMTNPAGLVFPEDNGTRPFERYRVDQRAQLEAFVSRRDPGWRLPLRQRVLDWVSLASVSVMLLLSVAWLFGARSRS